MITDSEQSMSAVADDVLTPPVAVEITRGDTVESVHGGVAAVVDHTGRLIAHFGDPDYVTYSRSSLKPIQALPTVMRGFPDCFNLDEHHLAILCGSHSGEECHVQAAEEILTAIGRGVDDYQCGVHLPYILKLSDGGVPAKSEFTALHNNCSGKHAGMLALAALLDCSHAEYLAVDSPVQTVIRETVTTMTGIPEDRLACGTDGCAAPNYAMPIRSLAHAYARLAQAAAGGATDPLLIAGARCLRAMRDHPRMVSGSGRMDLALAEASEGQLIPKVGGEAIQCIAVPERGWGITVKVTDGHARALGPLVIDLLRQLDLLDSSALSALAKFAQPEYRNHRGIRYGTARCVARLRMV